MILIKKQHVQNKSFSLIGHFLSDQIQLQSDIIAILLVIYYINECDFLNLF